MAVDNAQINGTCLSENICCGIGCCDSEVSCCDGVDCLNRLPSTHGCNECEEYVDDNCNCVSREEQCGIGESPCGDLCCNDATETCSCFNINADAVCLSI